jgi:hypothetical protein
MMPLPPEPPMNQPALSTENEIEQVSACAGDARLTPASTAVAANATLVLDV